MEHEILRSHFATSKEEGRGGNRYLPMAFTEHGILQLSNVLKSLFFCNFVGYNFKAHAFTS
jgi:hypothetical protein